MESPTPLPAAKPVSIFRQILRRDRVALSLIFIIMLMDVVGMTILFPISPYIVRQYSDLALNVTLLSVIYSAAQFFAAPLLGKLSDRWGRRPVLLLSLAGTGVGYLMFGFGGALWILFISRLIAGLSGGSISTASAYIVDVSKPEELSNAFTLLGMAWGIGLVLGPALGGALGQISLNAPAFFSAGLALINLVVSFFYLPESLPRERRETRALRPSDFNTFQSISSIAKAPGLTVLLVITVLFNFGFNSMLSTETLFIIWRFAAQPWQIGLMTMLVGLATAFVQAVMIQRLVPRFGEVLVAAACMLIQVVGALGMLVNPLFFMIYIIAVLRSAASGFIFPIMGTLSAKRVSHSEQGALMGVTTALGSMVGIIAPVIAGLMYDHLSPGAPYLLAMGFFAAATLLMARQKKEATLPVA